MTVGFIETSVAIYQSTCCNIGEAMSFPQHCYQTPTLQVGGHVLLLLSVRPHARYLYEGHATRFCLSVIVHSVVNSAVYVQLLDLLTQPSVHSVYWAQVNSGDEILYCRITLLRKTLAFNLLRRVIFRGGGHNYRMLCF